MPPSLAQLGGHVGMGDHRFDGLFESLEATFSAAAAAADRSAAGDLALTLQQDREAQDVLARGGWRLRGSGGARLEIAAIGDDYAAAADGTLVPLGRVIAFEERNEPPRREQRSLLQVLRGWVREGAKVQVEAQDEVVCGPLLAVGRDHLLVATPRGRCLVALSTIRRIRRRRGSSADAS